MLLGASLAVLSVGSGPPQSKSAGVHGLSVERPGDGSPVCGLGKSFHAGRREALRAAVREGLVIVRGLSETRDYTRFHQDKTFWYLTGVASPDATLVMDAKSGAETLYVPKKSRGGEAWEGEKWDAEDAWVRELTGFAEVRALDQLEKDLEQLLRKKKKSKAWVSLHPAVGLAGAFDRARPHDRRIEKDALDGRTSREKALAASLERLYGADVEDMSAELDKLRQVKTPEEIAAMRRAARAGALAMAEAMRSTRPGVGEWEIESLMSWIQVREGATGPAYHGIVGSGPNSLVLHYSASGRTLKEDEVLLIDYAPEVDHYTSDITRTWPVSGRFSQRQAELYDAVLAAQKAGIAAVRPGIKLTDVEAACSEVLAKRGFQGLVRHGACHWIGMEVHDVGDYDSRLEPGMAFTVEPGLYEDATGIGIRIEDVVVVTPEGCEVLSHEVPKERDAVEALVEEQGVLDWLDSQALVDGSR